MTRRLTLDKARAEAMAKVRLVANSKNRSAAHPVGHRW
jgi:hypothetical protein